MNESCPPQPVIISEGSGGQTYTRRGRRIYIYIYMYSRAERSGSIYAREAMELVGPAQFARTRRVRGWEARGGGPTLDSPGGGGGGGSGGGPGSIWNSVNSPNISSSSEINPIVRAVENDDITIKLPSAYGNWLNYQISCANINTHTYTHVRAYSYSVAYIRTCACVVNLEIRRWWRGNAERYSVKRGIANTRFIREIPRIGSNDAREGVHV